MKCPVCRSDAISPFLRRSHISAHQNLLYSSEKSARNARRGDLSLIICKKCGFAFNQAFDAKLLSYGKDYDNTQMCSSVFRSYIDELIGYLVNEQGVVGKNIVEIGCGDGSFLKSLCAVGGNCGLGFDPSYSGPEVLMDGRLRFKGDFYNNSFNLKSPDVVICRHVIEHVFDPVELLKLLGEALVSSPHAQLFFEVPCLEWILKHQVFWDFFYEHCSYYTEHSLSIAFGNVGFQVTNIRKTFQEQYLWLEAKLSNGQSQSFVPASREIFILAKQFAEKERQLIDYWQKRLRELRSLGGIAVWGAGAKGVTFVNMLDPNCEWIDCVVDINPNKQRGFVPGTAHPIVSYYDLPERNIATAILMNPNYREENEMLLKKSGIKLNLIAQE